MASIPEPLNSTVAKIFAASMRKPQPKEITGETFGHWTVASKVNRGKRFSEYECVCSCGTIRIVGRGNLLQGKTKSCGCMKSASMSALMTKHGMAGASRNKVYAAWSSMMTRCFNERNKSWPTYGGRGITVCERWMSFEDFLEDMGQPEPHQSLDRIDSNGNYQPDNCRWADAKTQTRNRRSVKLSEQVVARLRDGTLSPTEAAKSTGCQPSTAYAARRGQNWRDL